MATSAYIRVYNELRDSIANKTYEVGSLLPSEPELEKQFGVSRTTVRKAISMLVREGILSVKQGCGTRVVNRKAVHNLNRFSSISDSLAKDGHKLGLKSCYIERVGADGELAALLGVDVGTALICIHRIKTSDGAPICLIKNYIPEQLLPDMDMESDIPLLYDFLKKRYGICYSGSKDTISACNATFEQAQLLGIQPRDALFHVCRTCYVGFKPYEVDIVDIIADRYQYEVFMGDDCK